VDRRQELGVSAFLEPVSVRLRELVEAAVELGDQSSLLGTRSSVADESPKSSFELFLLADRQVGVRSQDLGDPTAIEDQLVLHVRRHSNNLHHLLYSSPQ
jgi:hypothetical protein